MKRRSHVLSVLSLGVALVFLGSVTRAAELEPPPDGLSARDVALKLEDVFRGQTSYFEGTMIIHSPRLPAPRRVGLKSWDDRPNKRSFIRITAPPKDSTRSQRRHTLAAACGYAVVTHSCMSWRRRRKPGCSPWNAARG